MSRVHDSEAGKVEAFKQESEKAMEVINPGISKFKDQLDDMCKTLTEMKEKLEQLEGKAEEEALKEEETLWQRLADNSLKDMFIGKDVTSEDVDNVVNTLTLMNALILTIPYGIMSSANYDYWDWVEATLASCEETDFTYQQNFTLFSNSFNSVMYSTISVLLMAMVYYLLRPKSDVKFRRWWKWARYTIFMMLLGTIVSCVALVCGSIWLFSWYMIPTSKFCTYSAKSQFGAGVGVVVLTFLIAMFLML